MVSKKRAHWESNPGLRTRNPMHYHYAIRPCQKVPSPFPLIQYYIKNHQFCCLCRIFDSQVHPPSSSLGSRSLLLYLPPRTRFFILLEDLSDLIYGWVCFSFFSFDSLTFPSGGFSPRNRSCISSFGLGDGYGIDWISAYLSGWVVNELWGV